jgi:dipeptidyl aminopeptidase/acylaminoacyl peptidase
LSIPNLAGPSRHSQSTTIFTSIDSFTLWTDSDKVRRWLRFKNQARRHLLFTTTCAFVFAFAVLSSSAFAQEAIPLSVEDALKLNYFGEVSPLQFSPDGERLAYVVRDNQESSPNFRERQARTGVPWHATRADIYLVAKKTGESINLTETRADNWSPTWSPDGHFLAFLSDRDGSGQARVWIWDASRNEMRKISDVNVRGDDIQWSPDGKTLFVTAVPRGLSSEDYAKILSSGKTRQNDDDVRKAPGSSVIVYRATAVAPNQAKTISDPWDLDVHLRDLVSIEVSSGRVAWIVHGQRITKFLLSPDGSRIAYSRPNRFEKPGSQQILFDLLSVDILGKESRTLASNVRLDYDGAAVSWSPTGTLLSFHASGTLDKVHDCYVVNLKSRSVENVTHLQPQRPADRKAETPLWDAKGQNFYFINDGALWRASLERSSAIRVAQIPNREIRMILPYSHDQLWTTGDGAATIVLTHNDLGKQDGFYRVDLDTGQTAKLLEKGQCYGCTGEHHIVATHENGQQLAYVAEEAGNSPDIWISSPDFQNPHRLTHVNRQFDKYHFGAAQLISWSSVDGEELHGALLLPSDYVKGNRYPLIVWAYGGDTLSDEVDHFGLADPGPFNLQMLATRGYAVLLPDAPQHLGTPMFDLAKTILPGVDEVISMGIADPDRLGVMGHSYGGYSVLGLIVQTGRFKAALESDGMADLISAYGQMGRDGTAFGTSITEQGQGLMGGTPWEFRERYVENSPFFYLDRVETPLLIIHGGEDKGVAPFLGDQVFVALRRLGKNVEYAKYEGEDHAPTLWSYPNQVDFCNRMIDWFNRYLGAEH